MKCTPKSFSASLVFVVSRAVASPSKCVLESYALSPNESMLHDLRFILLDS